MSAARVPASAKRAINMYRRGDNWNERRTNPKPTSFKYCGIRENWLVTRRRPHTKWMVPADFAGRPGRLAHLVRVIWMADNITVQHRVAYAYCGASLSNPTFKRNQPTSHEICWRCAGMLEHRR